MSSRRIFLNLQKIRVFNLIYLFLAFLSKCCVVVFGHKVFTTLTFWHCCSMQQLMLLQHCVFDVGFQTKCQRCSNNIFWSRFTDKNLKMYQFPDNLFVPKICKLSCNFIFLIKRIDSFYLYAKPSLSLKQRFDFENLKLVAWKEKRDLRSCLVYLSKATLFLTVNSVGPRFDCILNIGNWKTGVFYILWWYLKTIFNFNWIFTQLL